MNKEIEFMDYLRNNPNHLTENGVAFRMSKARKAESILAKSLDECVSSDESMIRSLNILQENEDPKHNPMQNALRKYYFFINGKSFGRKRDY